MQRHGHIGGEFAGPLAQGVAWFRLLFVLFYLVLEKNYVNDVFSRKTKNRLSTKNRRAFGPGRVRSRIAGCVVLLLIDNL